MHIFRARSGPRPRLQFTSEGVKAPGTGHNRLVPVTIADEKRKFVTKYGSCWQVFIDTPSRLRFLGYYESEELARTAFDKAYLQRAKHMELKSIDGGGKGGVYDGEMIASGVMSVSDKLVDLRTQAMKTKLLDDHNDSETDLNDEQLMKDVVTHVMKIEHSDKYDTNLDTVLSSLEEESLLAGVKAMLPPPQSLGADIEISENFPSFLSKKSRS